MKLWLVEAKDYDYDEFDSFVVRAETAEHAIELVTTNPRQFEGPNGAKWYDSTFAARQKPFTAVEIEVNGEAGVVLGSYNAG